MSLYNPDKWVIVKMSHPEHGVAYKILASWYGGYLGGDSWKLSSGITGRVKLGDWIEFPQYTKSIYRCHKDAYGMSSYTNSILSGWLEQLTPDQGSIELMDENFDIAAELQK